jgi:hypothetical protein
MELEDSREVAFCQFCGTKHVIKDEIINNTVINNYGAQGKGINELVADGEVLLGLNQHAKAYSKFKTAIDADPKDQRAWLGYAESSRMSKDPDIKAESLSAYETSYILATENAKEDACRKWIGYICTISANSDDHFKNAYSAVDERHKMIVLVSWMETDCTPLRYMYEKVTDAHKNIVFEKWIESGKTYLGEMFFIVNDAHKNIVFEKWTEQVEVNDRGYEMLYDTTLKFYGEGRLNGTIIPRWTRYVKVKISKNASRYDFFQVKNVFEFLDPGEKESLIYALLRAASPRWNVDKKFKDNTENNYYDRSLYLFAKSLCSSYFIELSEKCRRNFDFTGEEIRLMNRAQKDLERSQEPAAERKDVLSTLSGGFGKLLGKK